MQKTLIDAVAASEEDTTVNVKRTTLVTVFLVALAILAGTSFVALFAAYKAMSAANNLDEQWQQQHDRILRIEATSVQASADAAAVKADQKRVDIAMNELNKGMSEVDKLARQVTAYQSAKDALDAEKDEGQKKIADARAEVALQAEAAEKKGAENFDKLVAMRMHQRWMRPATATAGAKAEVDIHFAKDGTITNAVIATSSGVVDVDQSILKAAADLSKIPEMGTVSPVIYTKYLQQRRISFEM
ncbi:TonB family protein [Pseudomonas baetica]|uniref:TonB family protein n=1 Tax=Pseudomonas baetica TaxID=674054 RepID=UPI0024057307|nr:TonB family protein [Pseudomonas baetica]MDF9779311.1 TonB family protein [Pseudomonas baetica]